SLQRLPDSPGPSEWYAVHAQPGGVRPRGPVDRGASPANPDGLAATGRGVRIGAGLTTTLYRRLSTPRQDVGCRDPADFGTFDQDWDLCSELEDLERSVIAGGRVGVNLDLAGNEVDDPVIQNSSARIDSAFFALIAIESALRDLDQEHDVFRLGNSISVIITVSPHNGDIRFGFVEIGYPDGVLLAARHVR